jgi:hypothetical protein
MTVITPRTASRETLISLFFLLARIEMADRCPICYTEEEDPSVGPTEGNLRPCCRKFVCKSCMERWGQINNYCPLCKAQMRVPDEVLTESLSALLKNLSSARDCLQRIESVAEHITQSDTRSTAIRPIFTEVLDKGMKLGLLGSIPTMGPFTFGPQGEGIFGEAMSRDLISFMLAVGIRNTEPDFEIHFDVQEDRGEDRARDRAGNGAGDREGNGGRRESLRDPAQPESGMTPEDGSDDGDSASEGGDGDDEWEDVDD